MKRIKSLLAGLCTLALVAAFAVGSFGFVPTAFAAAGSVTSTTSAGIGFGADKAPAKTVKYGDTFVVPAATGYTVKVTDPSGKEISEYKATMLGNYTIKYTYGTDSTISFTYKMLSSLEDELELRIAEADIPSVVKKDAAVSLPGAEVGFYDEDGKWVSYPNAALKVTATAGAAATELTAENGKYAHTFDTTGTTFVKYVATLDNGTKRLEKTYEVKVQNGFLDTSAPTISVSGVPSSASVNTAVTLPVATATHGTDERVKVTVTVTDPEGNNVKEVDVNDDGFATAKTGASDVAFDNDKTMKFYPTSEGTYTVTYVAEADNGEKAYPRTYRISVSDKKAPVVEIDETKIPAKWGYNTVTDKDGNDKGTVVTFPFPSKLVDNKSAKDKLTVRFEITDPESKTAAKVENANSTDNNKNTVASYTGATDVAFTEAGFAFDFDAYANVKSEDSSYQVAGEYTVKYVVRDEANVSVTKTYTIELVDVFNDEADVIVSFDDVPSQTVYASTNEVVKFTVPAATVSCESDSKLSVTYKISGNEVKEGEEYEIAKKNGKYYLTIGETDVEVTSAGFAVEATAISDTGASTTASIDVKVVLPQDAKTFTTSNGAASVTVGKNNMVIDQVFKVFEETETQGVENLGVEIGFRNEEGTYFPVTAEFYIVNNNLVVRNIAIDNLGKDGAYFLEVKAFDRNGFEAVNITKYNVTFATAEDGGEDFTSAVKATSSEVNASVKLNKDKFTNVDVAQFLADGEKNSAGAHDKYFSVIAYEVKGGKFSVIGDDFTALNTGDYDIVKKPVMIQVADLGKDYVPADADSATALAQYLAGKEDKTTLAVSDTSTVKFELTGELVPYVQDLDTVVTLPKGVAYTDYANAEVTVKVTDPNGNDVKVTSDTFKATKNGTYTVTYTAKLDGKEDKTFSYTLKAGKVTAPEFTVADGKDYSAKIGSTFKFAKINKVAGDDDGKTYTYTKTLTLNGTTIATGTGRDYETSSDAITLSESGKYTVTYTVTDDAGNKSSVVYSVTVTSESNSGGISLAALSAILIVVGVLLIAGVIVYLFRFRTVKK